MPPSSPEPDLDIAEIVKVFQRRRVLFFWCIAGSLLLACLFLLVAKRRYKAEAALEVLSAHSSANISDLADTGADTSALQLGITMQTYVGLLTSERLALQVVRELNLEQTPEFHFKSRAGEENAPLENAPHRREAVLQRFERDLSVSAGAGSKLLTIDFQAADPANAKRVLNQLVQDFIAYNVGVGYSASERTESWLGGQLGELKSQVQNAEEAAAKAQRDTGIYGTDGEHNLVLSRLEALQQELINAEQNRIVKGAILHVVQTGDPEAISNLSSAAGQSTTPGSVNSLALIQTLRQQEASLSGQLADLSTRFGPAYPRVGEVQRQLSDIRSSIAAETRRLTQRANNDYRAAADQERSLQQQVQEQKVLANQSNNASIRYVIANREATSTRDLYERLLERSKELGVVAGLNANDLVIVDPAHVSASATPGIAITLLAATAIGLILGICAVLLRDSLDPTLFSLESMQRFSGLPLLASVPWVTSRELKQRTLLPHVNSESDMPTTDTNGGLYKLSVLAPESSFTESFRFLRARFQLSPALRGAKVILVLSPLHNEGKGVVTMNLAAVLAEQNSRVLVVDADLRRGTLTRHLGLTGKPGLADVLRGHSSLADVTPHAVTSSLDFLASGIQQPLSADLLGSASMQQALSTWKTSYDYVLLTTAPVLDSADAVRLAVLTDCSLLVVRDRLTVKKSLLSALQLLHSVQAPLAGLVYNAVTSNASDQLGFARQKNYPS